MNNPFRLPGFLALLASAALLSTSCDSKSNGAGSTDPLTTNFSVNMTSLMEAIGGKPDSVVAEIQVNGSPVQTLNMGPGKISESGLLRFPVDAAEGSKVQVVYKAWAGGGVVAAGSVTWVSGEALTVPRPNLAPSVALDDLPGKTLLVRRNAKVWIHAASRDAEGALAALLIDWNGDAVYDDSLVPPKGQDSIQVSWGTAGTYQFTAKVVDKSGLFRYDTLSVRVLSAATVRGSAPDSVSIRDTVQVDVAVAFDDSIQSRATRLVWSLPGSAPETTAVVASRSFVWPEAGSKTLFISTVDTLGEIDRDTVVIKVLQDAPSLDLGGFPGAVDLNTIASLRIKVDQSFGTIAAWGVDFDGDTTAGWDTTGTGPISSISHVFTSSGDPRIWVWVQDDDGNRVVKSGTLTVNASTDGAMLRRNPQSQPDTTVSIHDTTVIPFIRNFPPGVEAASYVEWIIDGVLQAPTPVAARSKFYWPTAGEDHFVAWRLVTAAGTSTWDTVNVRVLQDAPILDLSKFPRTVGLDMWATFRPSARQTWGEIVQWGMDFDGDTTNGWDVVRAGALDSLDRVFDREGLHTVRVFAQDDDGNRSVAAVVVDVQEMETYLVERLSADSVTISINDLAAVRFRSSFPSIATRKASRMVWTIDGAAPESLAVDTSRSLSWPVAGRHVARLRVVGPLGTTSVDSVVFHVVQGVPVIDLGAFPDTAGSGSKTFLGPKVDPNYGRIVRWKIDYDGDTTTGWDSTASGPAPVEIFHSFSQEGDSLVAFWVEDDDGNTAVSARKIAVVKGTYGLIQTKMGSDTTVSIGDTAWVRLFPGFSDLSEQSRSRLVWKVDWSQPETLQVVTSRGFRMLTLGKHLITFRAIGDFGATSWDTLRVNVVLDPPVLEMGIPDVIGRNAMVTFLPGVRQAFGSIVSWGMDLDGDTTGGWEIQGGSSFRSIARIFPSLGQAKILMWAIDDDGNRVVSSKMVEIRTGSGAVLALPTDAPREVVASIQDSVVVTLATNFDAETGPLYKLEWRIDGQVLDSTAVRTRRVFRWDLPGDRLVSFRAVGPQGPTSWDSVLVRVLQDRPTVGLGDLPVQPTRNAVTLFTPTATDGLGRIVRWGLDFDGDTTTWDLGGTGEMVKVGHVFPAIGASKVLAFAEDDDGNRVVATRDVVVKAGRGAISSLVADTIQVSIRDTVLVKLAVSFPVGGDLQNQYSLEWKVDAQPAETKAIVESRAFLWATKGDHIIRFRAVGGPWGDASWDSVVVQVVQGAPKVLNIFRTGSGVNTNISFSANVDPVFGSIVAGRWDWENDGVWDAEVGNPTTQGAVTKFVTSTPRSIRFQATDDDGNVVDTVFVFSPSNAAPTFGIAGFVESSVGVTLPATLRATFSDPDGVSDLVSLSIDWNADGTWDTVRNIAGLSSDEVRRSWSTTGTKLVRLLVTDKSGATALATTSIVVRADAPRILSFLEEARRSTARIGDTLWFVASVADSSLPADLDSIRWSRDGKPDTVVSLRGRSAVDSRMPVFASAIGTYSVKARVKDLVGNRDSAQATWRVVAAPPFVKIRLRDSTLDSRDTAHLFLDSLRTGPMGGKVASASWAFKNGGWTNIPSPSVGGSLVLSLPPNRDSLWYVVVRVVQDNGEVDYDTARANLLETFVDKRDGKVYPVTRVGKNAWMGRNLDWIPGTFDTIRSSCPDGLGCGKLGRLYTNMGPLREQIVSAGAPVIVSVCPDGWRMPMDEDFQDLLNAAYKVDPSRAPQLLRARTGWQTPLARQNDPVHFSALPTSPGSSGETAEWWFYDQGGWRGDWDARILNAEELTWGAPSLAAGASIRCVRLKEIILDSAWRRDGAADSADPITTYVRAYVPDSSAPVRIRLTFQGRVSEVVVNPVDHKVPFTTITYPGATRLGRELVQLEIEQNGVVARDSHWIAILGSVHDAREDFHYDVAKIGNQTWMARSVDYRGAGFLFTGDYPFANSLHYSLDQMMGGNAPEEGVPTGSQGICPDGFHIPSAQEWQTLVGAVIADGLHPKTALRQAEDRWDPGLPKGTNDYGFNGYPDGYFNGLEDAWLEGSFYLGADENGYSLFALDDRTGNPDVVIEGPYPKSTISSLSFALRCVKNP